MLSCFSSSFYGYSKPYIFIHSCINTIKSLKNKDLFTHQNSSRTQDLQCFIFTFYSAISQSNKQESQQLGSVWRWRPGLFWMKSKSAETHTPQQYFPRQTQADDTEQRLLGKNISTTPDTQRDWVKTSWVTPSEKEEAVRRNKLRCPRASSVWDKCVTTTPQDFLLAVPALKPCHTHSLWNKTTHLLSSQEEVSFSANKLKLD